MKIFFIIPILIIIISCESFSEYYAVYKTINKNDRIAIFKDKEISDDLIRIMKIDLQREGIEIQGYLSEDLKLFFDKMLREKKGFSGFTESTTPSSIGGRTRNVFTSEQQDITFNNQNSSDIKNQYFKKLSLNYEDYLVFLKNIFTQTGVNKFLHIMTYSSEKGLIKKNGYYITLYSFDYEKETITEDFNYFVTKNKNKGWKENFQVIYDRDISYAYVYENDNFITYKSSIKRKYELSRRITDLILGRVK